MGITTRGDQILDRTLAQVGGQGLFVKELELALACGDADLAVHSLEDVPMQRPDGFALVAVLEREDPRDAFVSDRFADIAALPPGARVGTSSPRRVAQLLALRPDLRIAPLRGKLDTRLGKLDAGGYDAIVLSAAGLMRLGLGDRVRSRFPVDQRISAAGQGAIGLEIATASAHLQRPLSTLRHAPTWLAVHAEQAVARMLGASCSLPLGAFASFDAAGTLTLQAVLGDAALGGGARRPRQRRLRARQAGDPARGVGAGGRRRRRTGARRPGRLRVARSGRSRVPAADDTAGARPRTRCRPRPFARRPIFGRSTATPVPRRLPAAASAAPGCQPTRAKTRAPSRRRTPGRVARAAGARVAASAAPRTRMRLRATQGQQPARPRGRAPAARESPQAP